MKAAVTSRRDNGEALSCGRDQTLALLDNGKALGWGREGSGRAAPDGPDYCSTPQGALRPVEIDSPDALCAVAAGHGFSLGVTGAGRVLAWGVNPAQTGTWFSSGSLAEGRALHGLSDVVSVAAGEFQSGAIDEAGAIWTWGLNADGALGRATSRLRSGPEALESVPGAHRLAVGKGFMLALTRDGQVYAWGSNAAGQLGLRGGLEPASIPEPVPLARKIGGIAAGATHSLAIAEDGAVFAWGSNHRGQLGRRHPAYSPAPEQVALPERVRRIAAGMHFSLALGESGRVYAWGWNGHGQLGLNDTADRFVATQVVALRNALAIAAGETHAAAVTSDGVYGWGNNGSGQLGAAESRQLRPLSMLHLSR
jgi:alpha-tubulin suppressor-like RCC1 family protein